MTAFVISRMAHLFCRTAKAMYGRWHECQVHAQAAVRSPAECDLCGWNTGASANVSQNTGNRVASRLSQPLKDEGSIESTVIFNGGAAAGMPRREGGQHGQAHLIPHELNPADCSRPASLLM